MTAIFPDQRAQKRAAQATTPRMSADAIRRRIDKLRALSSDQVEAGLTWLAGYNPAAFDSAIDAARTLNDGTERTEVPDMEPYCIVCGDPIGVFLSHGKGYRHYRGAVTAVSKPRPYKADHSLVIGWRSAGLPR